MRARMFSQSDTADRLATATLGCPRLFPEGKARQGKARPEAICVPCISDDGLVGRNQSRIMGLSMGMGA
jgi:hypothetical protein